MVNWWFIFGFVLLDFCCMFVLWIISCVGYWCLVCLIDVCGYTYFSFMVVTSVFFLIWLGFWHLWLARNLVVLICLYWYVVLLNVLLFGVHFAWFGSFWLYLLFILWFGSFIYWFVLFGCGVWWMLVCQDLIVWALLICLLFIDCCVYLFCFVFLFELDVCC